VSVLGEMSCKGGPSRKFSETFVLAEQPNGYYVLNDIFRYLKEDIDCDFSEEETVIEESLPVKNEVAAEAYPVRESRVNGAVESTPAVEKHVHAPVVAEPTPAIVQPPVSEVVEEVPAPAAAVAVPEPVAEVAAPNAEDLNKFDHEEEGAKGFAKTWASLADNGKERWAQHASEVKGKAIPIPRATEEEVQAPKTQPPHKQGFQQQGKHAGDGPVKIQRTGDGDNVIHIKGMTKATKIAHIKEEFAKTVGQVKWVDLITEVSGCLARWC
jgi:hypothetical protein